MRIVHQFHLPKMGGVYEDADFFVQLAAQGLLHRLAGFELAAGKLPIAVVHLARWPRGQQEITVGTNQHADRDIDHRAVRSALAGSLCVGDQHLHVEWSGVFGVRAPIRRASGSPFGSGACTAVKWVSDPNNPAAAAAPGRS